MRCSVICETSSATGASKKTRTLAQEQRTFSCSASPRRLGTFIKSGNMINRLDLVFDLGSARPGVTALPFFFFFILQTVSS